MENFWKKIQIIFLRNPYMNFWDTSWRNIQKISCKIFLKKIEKTETKSSGISGGIREGIYKAIPKKNLYETMAIIFQRIPEEIYKETSESLNGFLKKCLEDFLKNLRNTLCRNLWCLFYPKNPRRYI